MPPMKIEMNMKVRAVELTQKAKGLSADNYNNVPLKDYPEEGGSYINVSVSPIFELDVKPGDRLKITIEKVAILLIAFMALAASAARAQGIPDAPSAVKHNPYTSPLKDPLFYGGIANFAAAGIADVHNTTACEHTVPRGCEEAYKGNDRYAHLLPQLGLVTLGQYGCSLMLYNHHRWRAACLLVSLPLVISHWHDATTTYRTNVVARP